MARSEFLTRCRELADKKVRGGPVDCCNKSLTKTVHTSPAYQKLLGHAEQLEQELNDSKELARKWYKQSEVYKIERIPEELFDGYAVYENLSVKDKRAIVTGNVSAILDSAVDLIRKRIREGE